MATDYQTLPTVIVDLGTSLPCSDFNKPTISLTLTGDTAYLKRAFDDSFVRAGYNSPRSLNHPSSLNYVKNEVSVIAELSSRGIDVQVEGILPSQAFDSLHAILSDYFVVHPRNENEYVLRKSVQKNYDLTDQQARSRFFRDLHNAPVTPRNGTKLDSVDDILAQLAADVGIDQRI